MLACTRRRPWGCALRIVRDAKPMVRAVALLFCVLLPVPCHTVPTGPCRAASWQEPDDEQTPVAWVLMNMDDEQ